MAIPNDNGGTLVVSLTDSSVSASTDCVGPSRVGGKAAGLAKLFATDGLASMVPSAYALTVDFFRPWIAKVQGTSDFRELFQIMEQNAPTGKDQQDTASLLCTKLQDSTSNLAFSEAQSRAVQQLVDTMKDELVAVRSSGPEEDGSGASFAGAFETKLAVKATYQELETAIKACFASLWDYRVLVYKKQQQDKTQQGGNRGSNKMDFAVVVMEMVDSVVAGVAFSANPLNSDRDELVINSSWGLGTSVVDGSVTADRYVVDKIQQPWKVIEESTGQKNSETRLGAGKILTKSIDDTDPRHSASSLSLEQIGALSELVCLIERANGIPMDIEWALVEGKEPSRWELKLLQARPITTLFWIDPEMMTEPGEKRLLYFDFNIVSDATTTTPFTTMDMDLYCKMTMALAGVSFAEAEATGFSFYSDSDPNMVLYNGKTRQYVNMGWAFNFITKEKLYKIYELADPHLASILASKDCDYETYKTEKKWPPGVSWGGTKRFFETVRPMELYKGNKKYTSDPKTSIEEYKALVRSNMDALRKIQEGGPSGLKDFCTALCEAMLPSVREEAGIVFFSVASLFAEVDKQRRNGATEEIKEEYNALCGGFEGDELMEMNIALYNLAGKMPHGIWKEYNNSGSKNNAEALVERIRDERDLPLEFVEGWKAFLDKYGFDGQDQMFVSCPRYQDSPELLLEKLRLNAVQDGGASATASATSSTIRDPSVTAKEKVQKRRAVMAKQEEAAIKVLAETSGCFASRKAKNELEAIRKRNDALEHLAWVRNAPKLHLTKVVGIIRGKILSVEEELIAMGSLEEPGDIFHLNLEEVDAALATKNGNNNNNNTALGDLMTIVRPRKSIYERAKSSRICPLLVDSRCRILRPDPPKADASSSGDPNRLVGAALSSGVATGRVKIVKDLSYEQTKGFGGIGPDGRPREKQVLCAVVTGPAWTPLFASASAIVLQIGGVLQHGALCAREYGKPAVSNIDVCSLLRDGMLVRVDGDTGVVSILDDDDDDGIGSATISSSTSSYGDKAEC